MFFEKTGPTLRVNMDVDASSVWLWFGLISLISDKIVNNLDSSNKYFDTDSVPISWLRRIIHVLVWFGLIFFFLWQAKQISLMKSWRIQNQHLELPLLKSTT